MVFPYDKKFLKAGDQNLFWLKWLNEKPDSRLKRAGVSGFNKPKRTPNHPKKSHIVVAKEGDKVKQLDLVSKALKPQANLKQESQQDKKLVENLLKLGMQKKY